MKRSSDIAYLIHISQTKLGHHTWHEHGWCWAMAELQTWVTVLAD